jgi:hypothetical protein
MDMRFALLSIALAAGCVYNPGSYASNGAPFAGKRVQLACLDLAIAPADDALATSGPIVAYTFGNRCLHEIVVDLASVRAVGIDAAGGRHAMRATDPRRELVPMQLDAMWKGDEEIEYVALDATQPVPNVVCVDVGGIDRSAPHEQWACVGGAR